MCGDMNVILGDKAGKTFFFILMSKNKMNGIDHDNLMEEINTTCMDFDVLDTIIQLSLITISNFSELTLNVIKIRRFSPFFCVS